MLLLLRHDNLIREHKQERKSYCIQPKRLKKKTDLFSLKTIQFKMRFSIQDLRLWVIKRSLILIKMSQVSDNFNKTQINIANLLKIQCNYRVISISYKSIKNWISNQFWFFVLIFQKFFVVPIQNNLWLIDNSTTTTTKI